MINTSIRIVNSDVSFILCSNRAERKHAPRKPQPRGLDQALPRRDQIGMKPRRSQLSQARRRERLLVVLLGRTWRLAPGLKETQQLREAAHFGSIRKEARNLGTLVVMNDEVHAARLVTKSDTSKPSALCSPTAGPIGFVVEDRVRI